MIVFRLSVFQSAQCKTWSAEDGRKEKLLFQLWGEGTNSFCLQQTAQNFSILTIMPLIFGRPKDRLYFFSFGCYTRKQENLKLLDVLEPGYKIDIDRVLILERDPNFKSGVTSTRAHKGHKSHNPFKLY